jgi:Flp pilus assembly protein TadG
MQLEPRARRRLKEDDGFALIFVALILVALMVFAAMVVDIGGVYAKRRDDQNAADTAALAAVQELRSPNRETAMFDTVKQQAHTALGTTLSDAQWDSCPTVADDPGVLINQISFASCISYNAVRVRVRIPDQQYQTSFAGVIGRDTIRHSAFAIAGLEGDGFGGILPFAVTGLSAQGGLGCLKSNSNGQASALCGSTTGNFGFMDLSHYGPSGGDPSLGTTQSCGGGETQIRIERNSAMGVDHELSMVGTVHLNPIEDAPTACQAGTQFPDAATTQTGNLSNEISNGIFNCRNQNNQCPGNVFTDGKPARLQRSDSRLFSGGGSRINDVAGVDDLDDNPLWKFIPPSTGPGEAATADFPVSCKRDQFVDSSDHYYSDVLDNPDLDDDVAEFLSGVDNTRDQILALLNRCFTHYRGAPWDGTPVGSLQTTQGANEQPSGCGLDNVCSAPVFSLDTDPSESPNGFDIQYTSRFGYVPEISDFPSGSSQKRGFVRFKAVFIQRLVIEDGGNEDYFDPGFGLDFDGATPNSDTNLSGYSRVGETLAFIFPKGMLPNRLADDDAPFLLGVNRFPLLVR